MIKKKRPFHGRNHPPFWGVLAYEKDHVPHLKPDQFMSLLKAQYKNARLPDQDQQSKYLKAPFVM
jgi:hypothetical protein